MYVSMIGILLLACAEEILPEGILKPAAFITSHNRTVLLRRIQNANHRAAIRSRPMKPLPLQNGALIYKSDVSSGLTENAATNSQPDPGVTCSSGDVYCTAVVEQPPKFPLRECFTGSTGFLCCNRLMEGLMLKLYNDLASLPNFQPCNIQLMANKLQEVLQSQFNSSFETVVGYSDFASKSHFFSNYICKVKTGERYFLAYGTPRSKTTVIIRS